jgi:hypothetical protein
MPSLLRDAGLAVLASGHHAPSVLLAGADWQPKDIQEQKQMTTQYVWIWIAGVVLLGLALAYGIFRNRTRTSRERAVTEAATKERYRQERSS